MTAPTDDTTISRAARSCSPSERSRHARPTETAEASFRIGAERLGPDRGPEQCTNSARYPFAFGPAGHRQPRYGAPSAAPFTNM